MASNSTEFLEFEYWIFFDFAGSWARLRMASSASLNRALTTASSAPTHTHTAHQYALHAGWTQIWLRTSTPEEGEGNAQKVSSQPTYVRMHVCMFADLHIIWVCNAPMYSMSRHADQYNTYVCTYECMCTEKGKARTETHVRNVNVHLEFQSTAITSGAWRSAMELGQSSMCSPADLHG